MLSFMFTIVEEIRSDSRAIDKLMNIYTKIIAIVLVKKLNVTKY